MDGPIGNCSIQFCHTDRRFLTAIIEAVDGFHKNKTARGGISRRDFTIRAQEWCARAESGA
jgi:hypothetical protein